MQTKSKVKTKKTEQVNSEQKSSGSKKQLQNFQQIYEKCGAICGDGTFTQNIGKGAGSHHGGVKHYLYAKIGDISSSQINFQLASKASKRSNDSEISLSNCGTSQWTDINQTKQQIPIPRKTKKISLKDGFKTKTKNSSLFNQVQKIFKLYYKEEFQMVEEQIDEQIMLLIASVCNLYEEFKQAFQTVKALQDEIIFIKSSKSPSQKIKKQNSIKTEGPQDLITLKKQNDKLKMENNKIIVKIQEIQTKLKLQKQNGKKLKKLLKVVEKSDQNAVLDALNQTKIDIKSLKKSKPKQNKVITRSMSKKSQNIQKNKKIFSLFSSDSSDFQDQDQTLKDFVKILK